jgi:hypothetical protein
MVGEVNTPTMRVTKSTHKAVAECDAERTKMFSSEMINSVDMRRGR